MCQAPLLGAQITNTAALTRTCLLHLQITYWDAYDGQAIRIIDGSDQAQLNALATEPDGEALLSGGSDKLVKLWG
jgi:WD40 repeat protein